jgi:hypothetical protein
MDVLDGFRDCRQDNREYKFLTLQLNTALNKGIPVPGAVMSANNCVKKI